MIFQLKGSFNLKDLVEKVISNQVSKFTLAVEGLSLLSDIAETEKPKQNLVSPYFHFTSELNPWYSINLEAVKQSVLFKGDADLFALLLLRKRFTDKKEFH